MKTDSAPAISLFSFQDIITAITGILFLVVLMLLLILLDAPPEARTEAARETAAARARLKTLRGELSRAATARENLENRLTALRELSPEELNRREQESSARLAVLREDLRAVEEEDRRVRLTADDLSARLAALEKERKNRRAELEAEQKREQELTAAVRQQKLENEQRRKLRTYRFERVSGRIPVLAECGRDRVTLLNTETGVRTSFAASEAEAWTPDAFDRARHYFCLVFRPEAFRYAPVLIRTLAAAGFERGLEVLPDGETVLTEGRP